MKSITCNLPDSLYQALQERMEADKATCDHVVCVALSQCLGKPIHTLFQVSTSAALVEGLYQGAVRVSRLLDHGDFGLGTFIDLDGEIKRFRNHEAGRMFEIVGVGGAIRVCEGFSILRFDRNHFESSCFSIADVDDPWVRCDREPLSSISPEHLTRRLLSVH